MLQWILAEPTSYFRILQDHTDSSGMHGKALDALKEKLVDVETTLKREKESFQMSQVKPPLTVNDR